MKTIDDDEANDDEDLEEECGVEELYGLPPYVAEEEPRALEAVTLQHLALVQLWDGVGFWPN